MNGKTHLQKLLITLPDSKFFNIMRNYLGGLRTPFHKPDLIARLTAFLTKEEVQERILQCIDDRDAAILTAILFLNNPDVRRLFAFLSEQYDPFELHHLLINLEYRLLLFTDTSGESPRLICNPLLESRIRDEVFDLSVLFPGTPAQAASLPVPWLQDVLVAAFLSFAAKAPDILKADGSLKKKTESEARQAFPALFEMTEQGRKIDLLLTALQGCGILHIQGTELHVDWHTASELTSFPRRERCLLFWSSTFPGIPLGSDKKIESLARFIDLLPDNRLFTQDVLRRLARAVMIHSDLSETDPKTFIHTLTALGILVPEGDTYRKASQLYVPVKTVGPSFIIQPNLHITLKPDIPYKQALTFAQSADLLQGDVVCQLEITKSSFFRHLENSGPVQLLQHMLNGLQTSVPQPVSVLLQEWEKEYEKIKVYEGIIISVDPSLRHLIDHNPKLQNYVKAVIAPGVYLFAKEESSLWKEAFTDAGIVHLPAVTSASPGRELIAPLPRLPSVGQYQLNFSSSEKKRRRDPDMVSSELLRELESLDVSEEGREELTARISKRFILFPSQLKSGMELQFKTAEAKGIDFIGKVRLIEQAISTGTDVLEVIERSASGDPKRCIMAPVRLDRKGEQLLLCGKMLPGGDPVELQVRKLSLVRKMESILFTP